MSEQKEERMTYPPSGVRPRMFRQGDVLLIAVAPFDTAGLDRESNSSDGRQILAWGEATGHVHAVAQKATEIVIVGDDRYLVVDRDGAVLSHDEHGPIDLASGMYRIVRQREYVAEPGTNRTRPVVD
jgi:hypothetical protein